MKTIEQKIIRKSWSVIFYAVLAIFFFILTFAPENFLAQLMWVIIKPMAINHPFGGVNQLIDGWSIDPIIGLARGIFLLSALLYVIHVIYVLVYRNRYLKALKNKGVKKNGAAFNPGIDFSAIRGLVTSLLAIFAVYSAYDWREVDYCLGHQNLSLWVYVAIGCWIGLHLVVSILSRTNHLFIERNVMINLHEMFPDLVANNGKMVKPFDQYYDKYFTIYYLFPKENDDEDWSENIARGFKRWGDNEIRKFQYQRIIDQKEKSQKKADDLTRKIIG